MEKGDIMAEEKKDTQVVNIKLDRALWKQVGIKSIELDEDKKDFTEKALRERLERLNKE
ncbi:hypothetical protein H0266_18315 [Halobacillus locisalis]|uniref:Uncharacterized protein n=1 Tax=Halobacillus locisalis TaxID=220753 RepID=A0A838CXS5_9BACI|nr:hypothetical protein [Halobacillus locisalis]MBA2176837.1 hypothetical protein [Halobacillus locisalis]